jgi:hypothetical protein
MASEDDFLRRARNAVAVADRLQNQNAEGKLRGEKFLGQRESLNRLLSSLRSDNLAFVTHSIREVHAALEKVESQRKAAMLTEDEFHYVKRHLVMLHNDLEADKDAIELSSPEEYVTFLHNHLESKKYEHFWALKVDPRSILGGKIYHKRELEGQSEHKTGHVVDEDAFPFWAFIVAATLILASFAAAMAFAPRETVFLYPVYTAIFIGLAGALIHVATMVAGIVTSSISRAFKCLMLDFLISLVFLTIVVLVFSYSGEFAGKSPLSYAESASLSSRLILYVTGFIILCAVPFLCVRSVYDSNSGQAILAVAVNHAAWFVVNLFLRGFVMGALKI